MDEMEQKSLLQYQIKSKTFATNKIIAYAEQHSHQQLETTTHALLMGKENLSRRSNMSQAEGEKAFVAEKMELEERRD